MLSGAVGVIQLSAVRFSQGHSVFFLSGVVRVNQCCAIRLRLTLCCQL